jgi:hypothetical protein
MIDETNRTGVAHKRHNESTHRVTKRVSIMTLRLQGEYLRVCVCLLRSYSSTKLISEFLV